MPIEPINTATGKSWGAKAAAGDAMERVPNEAPFIAVWIDKGGDGGQIKWSKANTDYQTLSVMAMTLFEFAQKCIRKDLEA